MENLCQSYCRCSTVVFGMYALTPMTRNGKNLADYPTMNPLQPSYTEDSGVWIQESSGF